MQNVDYPAQWDRALVDILYAAEGVVSGFAVTPGGGLDIDISAGQAVVAGDEVANQGKYLVDSDAVVSLTLASVGSDRTEYVYVAINDPAVAGGRAGDNVTIETSTTLPTNSVLLLATLTLTSGTSTITAGMIADDRVYADVVAPGTIATAKLADGSVTTAKLADDAVTQAKIGAGAVGTTELAALAVSEAKIADSAVTAVKIGTGAVGETKLADGAVTSTKIGPLAVETGSLATGAVSTVKIEAGAVTGAKIGAGEVGTAKLANAAVDGTKIAASSVDSQHYVDGSIDSAHLSAGVVTFAKLAESGAGGTLAAGSVKYWKLSGFVFVLGDRTASASSLATLPAGYRPDAITYFPMSVFTAADGASMSISASGVINTSGYGAETCHWLAMFPAA